jgi:hypothetical protein
MGHQVEAFVNTGDDRMKCNYYLLAALSLAVTPLGQAFAQPAAAGVPPDAQAKIQQTALKSCNTDLDRDHFDYSTMEECVAAKTVKMERDYRASAAPAPARQPN